MKFQDVIHFWFEELDKKQWWVKDEELDHKIRDRFLVYHEAAVMDRLAGWRVEAAGRLAEIIILDQFSRNIFRDRPEAFASDEKALGLAEEAVALGADKQLPDSRKMFMYMPYMHSESPAVHEKAIRLFSVPGLEFNLEFELKHKKIIDRFGRYPHRNKILGRESTAEELEFLKMPGSSF